MKTFEQLGVHEALCKAVAELGFESPMPVQAEIIPRLLGGTTDLIALAQTGTGKTAAFGLPLLQNLDPDIKRPQALILAPTRELCLQIARDIEGFAKHLRQITVVAIYGGTSIDLQIRQLRTSAQITVATPGRLIDLMQREAIDLSQIRDVVLDEADEMLNMGFEEEIEQILGGIPKERHLLLFSATMSDEISEIARKYMHQAEEVLIGERNATNENIRHLYYMVAAKDKYRTLKRVVDYYPEIYGIVFCRTRRETKEIAEKLIQDGYNAEPLHGELSQQQRESTMQKFRMRGVHLLVATDVAARGLDVNDLTHVIHFGLPDDLESYTHRSGRTARAGKSGLSVAICHVREKSKLKAIGKGLGIDFERAKVPSGEEICNRKLYHFVDTIEHSTPPDEQIAAYAEPIISRLAWLSKEDLIKRMLFTELERLITYYENEPPIEEESKLPKEAKRSKNSPPERTEGMIWLCINFGKADKIYPNTLIDIINRCMEEFVKVGKIDIYERKAFFEIPAEKQEDVVEVMSEYELAGRTIRVWPAAPKEGESKGNYRRKEQRERRREQRKFTKGYRSRRR